MDPSEKERARKRNRGSGGKGGITDNILFNYCLNKNIVFLKERNQFKSNKTREKKEMKSKHLICKSKRGNGKPTEERKKKRKKEGNPGKTKPVTVRDNQKKRKIK